MASKLEYWFRQELETKKKIVLPTCIFNTNGLEKLEKVLKTRNPILVSNFYKNFGDYTSLSAFEKISEALKKIRKVTDDDKELITAISSIKKKDSTFFFHYAGNLFYIAKIADEIVNSKELKKILSISLFLWIYLNMIEISTRFISEIVEQDIKDNKLEKEYSWFTKKFKDGEHPTLGEAIQALQNRGYLKRNSTSIFIKSKLIRNKMSHANMFYDEESNLIYLTNGQTITIDKFLSEFELLKDFLFEYLFQFNDNEHDLVKNVNLMFRTISDFFLKVERSGPLKRAFNEIVFEWE
jgi:hypothetical protein